MGTEYRHVPLIARAKRQRMAAVNFMVVPWGGSGWWPEALVVDLRALVDGCVGEEALVFILGMLVS
jgi:hypothetical protein